MEEGKKWRAALEETKTIGKKDHVIARQSANMVARPSDDNNQHFQNISDLQGG